MEDNQWKKQHTQKSMLAFICGQAVLWVKFCFLKQQAPLLHPSVMYLGGLPTLPYFDLAVNAQKTITSLISASPTFMQFDNTNKEYSIVIIL